MIVEIIVHDREYPNGNSWKYGFSSVDEAVNFLKSDKEHLQTLGGLTKRAADGACTCALQSEIVSTIHDKTCPLFYTPRR